MKKLDIVVTVIVLSLFIFGLMYFTREGSISERNVTFEILSMGILVCVSLFTYWGIRKNLHH